MASSYMLPRAEALAAIASLSALPALQALHLSADDIACSGADDAAGFAAALRQAKPGLQVLTLSDPNAIVSNWPQDPSLNPAT